jgi:hypothetical protein
MTFFSNNAGSGPLTSKLVLCKKQNKNKKTNKNKTKKPLKKSLYPFKLVSWLSDLA